MKYHDYCPSISKALRNALHRVRRWEEYPEEHEEDIRDYLTWQMQTIADEMKWYFDRDDVASAVGELFPLPVDGNISIVDPNGSDAINVTRTVLNVGRLE